MSSRIKSLLNCCGINSRFIMLDGLLESIRLQSIDYLQVSRRIEKFAKKSSEWLWNSIK